MRNKYKGEAVFKNKNQRKYTMFEANAYSVICRSHHYSVSYSIYGSVWDVFHWAQDKGSIRVKYMSKFFLLLHSFNHHCHTINIFSYLYFQMASYECDAGGQSDMWFNLTDKNIPNSINNRETIKTCLGNLFGKFDW